MTRLFYILTMLLLPLSASADAIQVFVSVLPQKYFVEQIGGELVTVDAMVTPGQSPATYNPTPRQIQKLADAKIFFRTGVPYEDAWLPRIQSTNPTLKIVDARDSVYLLPIQAHHQDTDHGHHDDESPDPHIWTSPINVIRQSEQIRDSLIALLPQHSDAFTQNTAAFIDKLQQLDIAIHAKLAHLKNRRFMVFHPSWAYFADRYQLHQVSVEREGKEPGAKSMAQLISQARRELIQVIFIQPQFSQKAAQTIAAAINGRVAVIDPLAENYFDNLSRVADLLSGELQ